MKYMVLLSLMLLGAACRLCSMKFGGDMEFGGDINAFTLNIYPDQRYTIEGVRGKLPIQSNFAAFLTGNFSQENDIQLFPVNGSCSIDGRTYTPWELMKALATENETEAMYPITWHEKMKKMPTGCGDKLEFIVCKKTGGKIVENIISMPEKIKKQMARYLLKDMATESADCFHLCNNVVLTRRFPGEEVDMDLSLIYYMDFIQNNKELHPGDMIGFFINDGADGKFRIIKMIHYAFMLTRSICLSKWQAGGTLSVTGISSLLRLFKCDGYMRIAPFIGKRSDFLQNPFRKIVYRDITMEIHPYMKTDENGHLTLLSGFNYIGEQFRLRSGANYFIEFLRREAHEKHFDGVKKRISNGVTGKYPLDLHRSLNYLTGNEVLRVLLYKSEADDETSAKELYVPNHVKRNFFNTLLNDTQISSNNCFTFCQQLSLDCFANDELFDERISCSSQKEKIREIQLLPGNIVMLSKDGVKGEHYAMYLYDNCYLSQLGNGGPIVLTDLDALRRKYQTTEIIRIKPGITQYKDFLVNRLPIH